MEILLAPLAVWFLVLFIVLDYRDAKREEKPTWRGLTVPPHFTQEDKEWLRRQEDLIRAW